MGFGNDDNRCHHQRNRNVPWPRPRPRPVPLLLVDIRRPAWESADKFSRHHGRQAAEPFAGRRLQIGSCACRRGTRSRRQNRKQHQSLLCSRRRTKWTKGWRTSSLACGGNIGEQLPGCRSAVVSVLLSDEWSGGWAQPLWGFRGPPGLQLLGHKTKNRKHSARNVFFLIIF